MLSTTLTAPEGWTWLYPGARDILGLDNVPSTIPISRENDSFRDKFRIFFEFVEENDLKALGFERAAFNFVVEGLEDRYQYRLANFWSFELFESGDWRYDDEAATVDKPFTCNCGSEEYSFSSVICHGCNNLLWCISCRQYRQTGAFFDGISGTTHCEYCGEHCECGRYHGGYTSLCEGCSPRYSCNNCGSWTDEEPLPIGNIAITARFNNSGVPALFCGNCRNLFCEGCEDFVFASVDTETHLCQRCEFLGPDGDKEMHDEDSNLTYDKLQLPSIPGREMIRLCGVEIEGGLGKEQTVIYSGTGERMSGPNSLARALYDNDLSQTYRQEGYHHGAGFARVETDSSCDWECVIGPVNMADLSDVEKLNEVVKLIKMHIKSGALKLDLRCGTHIHVSAERVSLGQAYNLHLLYTFMEDVLYRLGASHWPVHRILIQGESSHGAQKSPKMTEKVKFARTFHANRYFGLSFNNYFERMFENCMCGAVRYGVFEDCTCDLGKCTFEFRLFNSTANTIKLHAFLALCQSLVAKAISMPEVKDSTTFEELPFLMQRYKDMDGDVQTEMIAAWEERLSYIATDLPLTDEEKKSILYCINNSELSKVSDSIKKLYKGDAEPNMKNTTTEMVEA